MPKAKEEARDKYAPVKEPAVETLPTTAERVARLEKESK